MSAAAQSNQAQKQLPKVLRIGVVNEGKIAQERLLRVGEAVTVGDSQKNLFPLASSGLGASHTLFLATGGNYALVVPESIEGKISWKDGIRDLSDLRARGEMQKKGEFWHLPLNENVRGKVALGSTTLLFQFVNAPPEPVRAVTSADFRPRLFSEDDPLFLGLLAVFNGIAVLFYVAIMLTPPGEDNALDALKAAEQLVTVQKIEAVQIAVKPTETDAAKTEEKKPEKAKAESKEDSAPKAKQEAPSAESVAKKSLLLQMLGTTGAGSDQMANDILGDAQAQRASLDSALSGVTGAEEASGATLGLKQGGKGGQGDAAVGITASKGGTAGTGTGAAVVVKKPKVDLTGDGDVSADSGDAANVGKVMRANKGRIETCVQRALAKDPAVNGRVGAGWTISKGKVTESHITKNSTGDSELGDCIVRAVRGIRFDESLTASVDEYAWVVSGQ